MSKAETRNSTSPPSGNASTRLRRLQQEPPWVRWVLITLVTLVIGFLIVIPVAQVFAGALSEGVGTYVKNLVGDPDTRQAIGLTLTVVPIALAANVLFGISAAWAVSRFSFPGRTLLVALIDLPFAVSPVVAGLMFVLIFGLRGYLGEYLRNDGYAIMPYLVAFTATAATAVTWFAFGHQKVRRVKTLGWSRFIQTSSLVALFFILVWVQQYLRIWPEHKSLKMTFATPGLVLATAFVTCPFIARELIPVMDALGADEELAAISLGASGWQCFGM